LKEAVQYTVFSILQAGSGIQACSVYALENNKRQSGIKACAMGVQIVRHYYRDGMHNIVDFHT
jgi:hypothetical protein